MVVEIYIIVERIDSNRKWGDERVGVIMMVLAVWIIAIVCIFLMKKIQPTTYKAYAIYVLTVCVILTGFVIYYVVSVQGY